jgi:ABC-2 type transport system permease protein
MTRLLAILRVTTRHLLGGRRILGLGLIGLVPAIIMWFTGRGATAATAFGRYHEAPLIVVLAIVLPIVTIVLASGALGDERREHTLSFLLVRPVSRPLIVTAKLVAAWVSSMLVVGGSAAATAGILSLQTGDSSVIGPTLVAVAVGTAAYAAVFLVIGYLTSRAVLAGLVFVFVWESGIAFALAQFANFSLYRIGVTAYVGLVPESRGLLSDTLGSLAPGAGGAAAKALVLAALAIAASAWLLRRSDATIE